MSKTKENLIGQNFGRLTVIEKGEDYLFEEYGVEVNNNE